MLDIQNASYEELKAARDEITVRIREVEKQSIEDLQARAAQFGLELIAAQPKKERRKRRSKAEIEADNNGYAPN